MLDPKKLEEVIQKVFLGQINDTDFASDMEEIAWDSFDPEYENASDTELDQMSNAINQLLQNVENFVMTQKENNND